MKNNVKLIKRLKRAILINDLSFIERNMPYFDVNLRFKDEENNTPLLYSISKKNSFAYRLFLETADLSITNDSGENLVHSVVYSGDEFRLLEVLDYCLPLINSKANDGATPLLIATAIENFGMVKLLVENGADVNEPDSELLYPIHIACDIGSLEMVNLFISNGAKLKVKSKKGNVPFSLAVNKGFDSIAKLLFSKIY